MDPAGACHQGCVRPSLPPAAWGAACLWWGCVCAEALAWNGYGLVGVWASALAFAVSVGVALARTRARSAGAHVGRIPGWIALVTCMLTLGLVIGGLYWARVERGAAELRGLVHGAQVEAVADGSSGRFSATVRVRIRSGIAQGATASAVLPSGSSILLSGERAWVRGAPDGSEPRDEWARRRHRAGESARVRVWSERPLAGAVSVLGMVSPVRRRLLDAVATIPGEQGALLQGVLLGERNRLRGTKVEADFRTTGLSHVLAVSGTHLVIVAYMLGVVLSRTPLPAGVRVLLIVGCTGVYVLLTGSPASSVRALLMGGVAGAAGVSGRRNDALSALAASVCLILVHSPAQAFDIGFALSVAAVAGLVVFSPLADRWALAASPRLLAPTARALSTPLVAQAATAPLAIPVFGMVSLIGPVANIVVVPPSSLSLGIGVVGALLYLVVPALGMPVLRLAALPMGFIARATSWLAALPYAAIPLGGSAAVWGAVAALASLALWVVWPQPRTARTARRLVVACVVAGMVLAGGWWAVPTSAEIVFLDVGQGDAVLIRDKGHSVLIDTGPNASSMRQAAARAGLRRLDAVLLTHPHADHTGGIGGLVGVVSVDEVLVPEATSESFNSCAAEVESVSGTALAALSQGQALRAGAWRIDVLWPPPQVDESIECNDASFIVRVSHPSGFSAILTGDAEAAAQRELLETTGLGGPCDVLKVPHHGSSEGIEPAALAAWSPRLAAVSVGEGNEFGHPAASTLEQLADSGATVVRTDHSGDIRVRVSRRGFRVLRNHAPDAGSEFGRAAAQTSAAGGAHGRARVACATIASAAVLTPHSSRIDSTGHHDSHGSIGSQARVSHIRLRGPPSRAGDRAAQEALLGCGRPRVQLPGVRGREHNSRRRHRGGEHLAFHG